MNYLIKRLRDIVTKNLQHREGVVVSNSGGQVKIATKKGVKVLDAGTVNYKEGDRITFDANTGIIGKKRKANSTKIYRV